MANDLFGDDEMTAGDGVYLRAVRVRKWLYLASGSAVLFAHFRFDGAKLSGLLGDVVQIDDYVIAPVLLSGFAILSVQYFLLLWQNWIVRDLTIAQRLGEQRQARIEAARAKLAEVAAQQSRVGDLRDKARNSVEQFQTEFVPNKLADERAQNDLSEAELKGARNQRRALLGKAQTDLAKFELDLRLADEMVRERRAEFNREVNNDPKNRRFFLLIETCLDYLRLVPPAITAIAAWIAVGIRLF